MPSEHHPVSLGRLCARGWAAHEASLWSRRVEHPLVRRHGALQPATWEDALSEAARGLRAVVSFGRPVGVLGSGRATNEENFLAARLARGAIRTPHVDACLGAPYRHLLAGVLEGGAALGVTTALADLAAAELILLFEDDLARTHPRVAFAILCAVHAGARLVTLGPVKTQLSRLARRYLPLLPGDLSRVAGELEALSRGDSVPQPAADAFSGLREAKRPAIVLALSGSAADLRRLARALGTVAADARRAHASCLVLPVPTRANTRGALEMGAAPAALPGLAALDDEAARRRVRAAWECEIVAERGLDAEGMLREVSGLVVLADHPPAAAGSGAAAQAKLDGLDCLVTLDAFWTPTVAASHVVLPIAGPLETEGTFTNLEGRVQRLRACMPAPAQARPGWRALNDLGAALGLPSVAAGLDDVRAAIAAAVPPYAPAMRGTGSAEPVEIRSEAATAPRDRSAEPRAEGSGGGEPPGFPLRLARVGSFEWGEDPLVSGSPTLRRDYLSLRKRYPDGLVAMSPDDARRLGVREGWRVRIASRHGTAVTAVQLRSEVEPGVLLAPFGFRDQVGAALGGEVEVPVRVEVA
jgi:predicted molibdopterin-dependent oxidoreductase YjgC